MRLLAVVVLASVGVACQDDTPAPESLDSSSFAASGGCNQAAFWAVNAEETTALWVSLDLGERRDDEETLPLPLTSASSMLELRRGVGLRQPLCGDTIAPPYQVDSAATPVSGTAVVRIGPPPTDGCGTTGSLGLRDVVFSDGTTIDSLDIETEAIGCFAG